ncbi:MAG: SDR family NAD(P)-dependent oxidoreductase [Lentisphaeria bacterium]
MSLSIQCRLFNNAGVDFSKAFEQTEANDWVRVVDTDLRGICLCARRVVLEMLKSGGGVIVDIAFVHSIAGLPSPRMRTSASTSGSPISPWAVGKPEEIANGLYAWPATRPVKFATFAGFPPDGPPRTCATLSATRP